MLLLSLWISCSAVWEVLDDADFRPQEGISCLSLGQWRDDDKLSAECWASRCSLDVRGATGPYAASINGLYDPTEDFVAGYRKRADPTCVMDYSRRRKLWQMKSLIGK